MAQNARPDGGGDRIVTCPFLARFIAIGADVAPRCFGRAERHGPNPECPARPNAAFATFSV
jgi:hypothetical protein